MKNEIFIDGLTGLFLDYLVQLLLDLAKSPLTTETSEAGQTLRLIRERKRDSVSAQIYRINRIRKSAIQRRLKKANKRAGTVKKSINKSMKKAIKKTKITKTDWDSFIDEIKC